MQRTTINTIKNGNGLTYNNGFSFPSFSGSTSQNYKTSSSGSENNCFSDQPNETKNEYSICIDWLEFICKKDEPIEVALVNNQNPNIISEKIHVHRNPNFHNLHKIYFDGVEAFDIYSQPNNGTHQKNELSVKVSNVLLYSDRYFNIINEMLQVFGLEYVKVARLDIALDGAAILNLVDILNKFVKSHTIQTNNDALSILPTAFNKKELRWLGWSIGKAKSGISARIYNKSEETLVHRKDYIASYWRKNKLFGENIGRFEIQLNSRRIKKYNIDLPGIQKLTDARFVSTIFKSEVQSWLKFYRVRRKDFLNHKKEVALKKGKEIQFIMWDKLPVQLELLTDESFVSNSGFINARNSISFSLHEILKNPSTSSTAQIEVIKKYADDYCLWHYVRNKVESLFIYGSRTQLEALKNQLFGSDSTGD